MDAREFFYRFGQAIYHLDAVYDEFAKSKSCASSTLMWILYALNDGKPHTQKEICLDWALPKSTVNTIMSELKKNRQIELVPIKGKRREMTIVLTESGKAYANELLKDLYGKEAEVFAQLDLQDLQIISSMNKITELLKQTLDKPQE